MSQQGDEPSKGTPLEIQVNLEGLTFDDLQILEEVSGKDVSFKQMKAVLDKVVVGGVGHLPVTLMPQIAEVLKVKIKEMGNPVAADLGN